MSKGVGSNQDKVDQKIIEILNNNARIPSKKIASELKKSGHDFSDRTIRKRIESLEKSGIIKRYKVLTDVSGISQYQLVLMKINPSKSMEAVKNSIKNFVTKLENYVLVSMKSEGNMRVIIQMNSEKSNTSQKTVEKIFGGINWP